MDTLALSTPIGTMIAKANEAGVYLLEFVDDDIDGVFSNNPMLLNLKSELDEYFVGKRQVFTVPLALIGTPFQMDAWDVLRRIPYGETVSYAMEAKILGRPTAVRAVANANGKNPISIIIPCHRVIASGGGIGGYSGGIWRKEFLLALEQKNK